MATRCAIAMGSILLGMPIARWPKRESAAFSGAAFYSTTPIANSQQAQMLQVRDVFVDQRRRQVRNVLLCANFGCPYRGLKHLSGRGCARQRLFRFAIGAEQGQHRLLALLL